MNAIAYYAAYKNGANAREMIKTLGLDELNKNASEDYIPLSVDEFEKKADMEKFEGSITDALGGLGDLFRQKPELMWGLGGAGLGALLSDNPLWGAALGGAAGWGGYKMFGQPSNGMSDTIQDVTNFAQHPINTTVGWGLKKSLSNALMGAPYSGLNAGIQYMNPALSNQLDQARNTTGL